MPRPRKTISQARDSGAVDKNPGRYVARMNPPKVGGEIGTAPMYFTPEQIELWDAVIDRAPRGVITAADSYIVEIVVVLLAKLRNREDPLNFIKPVELGHLRAGLGSLGMTPVDRARLNGTDEPPQDDDPLSLLLGGAGLALRN